MSRPSAPTPLRLGFCLLLGLAAPALGETIALRSALDDSPLPLTHRADQTITPAVAAFHESGVNPYAGDEAAIADGQKVYKRLCQSCHMPDGSGRIGPRLDDDTWKYARAGTEIGRFEIIYGGGAGAMQAFGKRVDQDDILKVMAFIDTFRQ